MLDFILLAVFIVVAVAGFFWRKAAASRYAADPSKKNKRDRVLALVVTIFSAYLAVGRILTIIFGKHQGADMSHFSPWAARHELFGLDISVTVLWTWVIMAALLALAVLARIIVLKELDDDKPKGARNAIEFVVETAMNYAGSNVHGEGEMLGCYIFTVCILLVGCAVVELFGIRTPASDITFTLGLGLVTFVLVNIYGIKKKGIGGRIKSLAQPTPIVLPIKIITDLAIPVSLAARLFGNMLGGMIIMDLVYSALGNNGLLIPPVVGLYFNVFHPLLQAFIFVTLSLTFIREAVE